jgi:predicted nucleic acid-binding protein
VGQIVNLRPISNRPAADAAARIRAMYGLRTPDSLQAATALRSHVTGLVTNDPVFERVDLFETLVLDRVL